MNVIYAKTVQQIEVQFGLSTRQGTRNRVLGEVGGPSREGQYWHGRGPGIVNLYKDHEAWAVQRRLTWLRWCLACGPTEAQGTVYLMEIWISRGKGHFWRIFHNKWKALGLPARHYSVHNSRDDSAINSVHVVWIVSEQGGSTLRWRDEISPYSASQKQNTYSFIAQR